MRRPMRPRSWLVPAFALLLPIVACGVDDDPPVLAIKQKGPMARFTAGEAASATPTFLDVPFPSDAYMKDGKFSGMPGIERTFKRNGPFLSKQLETLNGWSRIAGVMFAIDDPRKAPNPDTLEPGTAVLDRSTLPATEDECKADGSSVFLLDLDGQKRVPCRAVWHDEEGVENGRSLLIVGPARGIVLEEGHHYCAVITSRLKDAEGTNVGPSEEFVAAAEKKEGPLAGVYGAAFDKVTSILGGALGGDRIVALSPYTTQKSMDDLYAAREVIEAAPAATLKWDAESIKPMTAAKFAKPAGGGQTLPAGFTASLDAWLGVVAADKKLPDGTDDPDEDLPVRAHDKIAAVGTAVFDAINFLQVKPGKYDDVGHAAFARDGAGKPVAAPEKPTSKIWISISIPDAPMPPDGFPAVIIQHGLSGSRAYLMTMANTFAKKGWIAVAIDSVTFGARANDPKFLVDATSDYANAPGNTYKAGDGISDIVQNGANFERAGSFDFFGGLKNLLALRDQLRQAALDTAQVVKVLRSNPDLTPLQTEGAPPKIDAAKIAYVGDSLGGIEGAVAAAIEPNVKAWTLNVAGGGILIELAGHGPVVNANLSLAGSLNFGFLGGSYDEGHPVVVIGQALMDAGDPISFAERLSKNPAPLAGAATQPRNVLQIEVLYDELVANESNEALARAAGWSMASPNVGLNAGSSDGSGASYRSGGIVLPMLEPQPAAGYKDIPVAGSTALIAQVGPAHHGADLVRGTGNRQYRIPFNTKEGRLVVDRLNATFAVPCPYRELQASMVGFFESAFAGGGAPVIAGLPAPARDTDGDGAPDSSDPDAVDENKK
jgi:dienelactone hydrolase